MKTKNNKIAIIDSTLRDGEQAPGVCFSRRDKLRLALPLTTEKSCRIDPAQLQKLCDMVARLSHRVIPASKPVTGDSIFTHESGIHGHALLQDNLSYQPYPAERVGKKWFLLSANIPAGR